MSAVARRLWEAARKVETCGVARLPYEGETCAYVATGFGDIGFAADDILGHHLGIDSVFIPDWNDAQPSRAVVAAAMRDAAFLAEWAGPWLLGGSK